MPPTSLSNYYIELELEKSASQAEITAAFRRLARLRHPDKNPDDQAEATTAFQQLQTAYETLSDPEKRRAYDMDLTSRGFGVDRGPSPYDNGDFSGRAYPFDVFEEESDEGEGYVYCFTFSHGHYFYFHSGTRFRSFWEAAEAVKARQAREESERLRQEEKKAQEEVKEKRARAREADKAMAEQQRQRRRFAETEVQEARWRAVAAVTEEERRQACLHSDFCTRTARQKKFKCGACGVKRGLLAFECPHCSTQLCQLCLAVFGKRRARHSAADLGVGQTDTHGDEGMAWTETAAQETPKENATVEDSEEDERAYDADAANDVKFAEAVDTEPNNTEKTEMRTESSDTESKAKNEEKTETDTKQEIRVGTEVQERKDKLEAKANDEPSAELKEIRSVSDATRPVGDRTNLDCCNNKENIPSDMQSPLPLGQPSQPHFHKSHQPSESPQPAAARSRRKPWHKPSKIGPDPGYEASGRHKRCFKFHRGGDAKCYVLHPENRPRRNTESGCPSSI